MENFIDSEIQNMAFKNHSNAKFEGTTIIGTTGRLVNTMDNKKTEIQLQQYTENLTRLDDNFFRIFNLSPAPMMIVNKKNGVIIYINQQFINKSGYPAVEVIGREVEKLDLFDNLITKVRIRKVISGKEPLGNFEFPVKNRSGELLHLFISINPFEINESEYLLISATDITLLKDKEKKIRHLLEQQKIIAHITQLINHPLNLCYALQEAINLVGNHTDVSRVYIFENDRTGNYAKNTYEWHNVGIKPWKIELQNIPYTLIPSWKKILDDKGIILSKNICELPEDIYVILAPQNIKSILVYPLRFENIYYGFIGFDECTINKSWALEDGEILRTVSNIISSAFARKNYIDNLICSELRYKLAIESAKESLWDWNILTGEFYISEIWCRMIGYELHEFKPHISSWENWILPDDRSSVMEALNNHLSGKTEIFEANYRIKTKDKKIKWFLIHGIVVERDASNSPVRIIGTNIDISGRKVNEIRLEEAIETQKKLLSIISHDLRESLINLMQGLELLSTGGIRDEIMKDIFLTELQLASQSTFSLFENLLSWSRSQNNAIMIRPACFNLLKMLRDNTHMISSLANKKSIEIKIQVDKTLNAFFDIDSINLVVRNLLSNAIKFTHENGIINVSAHEAGKFAEIEVADNGVGMEKGVVENLFNSRTFYTTYGTNKEKGSGIGLALCKDFVERNGGVIHAESIKGKGSKFIFSVPLKCRETN
jgi:PAS domain S-box-containing protein